MRVFASARSCASKALQNVERETNAFTEHVLRYKFWYYFKEMADNGSCIVTSLFELVFPHTAPFSFDIVSNVIPELFFFSSSSVLSSTSFVLIISSEVCRQELVPRPALA
jgi:hypothetical protein